MRLHQNSQFQTHDAKLQFRTVHTAGGAEGSAIRSTKYSHKTGAAGSALRCRRKGVNVSELRLVIPNLRAALIPLTADQPLILQITANWFDVKQLLPLLGLSQLRVQFC